MAIHYINFYKPKEFLLNTRYLKSLIAIIENGSIADAARVEHLTAAAIGQRVQSLELELGITLLSRAGHTARPTQACIDLLPRMKKIVREAELLKGHIGIDGLGGILRIGAISTALTGILPSALRKLIQAAPNSQPIIVPGTSRELFQMLQTGKLDAAIIVAPPFELPNTLKVVLLRNEPLIFLASSDIQGSPAMLLNTEPYIRYAPDAWGSRHASAWLANQDIEPRVLCDLDALETIAMLVSDKMGVGLVPQWTGIKRFINDCQVIPIEGKCYERSIILVSNATPDLPKMNILLEKSLLSLNSNIDHSTTNF